MSEVIIERGRGVSEYADGALRISVMPNLRPGHHIRDTLLIPIRRPEITVIYGERETAGPACQAGELPATDERISYARGSGCKMPAVAEWKFDNPVGVDLMGEVEI